MQIFKWKYNWRMLAGDLQGGFIAALIALPYGLSMASMMGLPPVLGLVTSIITAPITALLGRNPVLIGGTASATVPFISHAVSQQGLGGAAKVCLVASVFMTVFSVMRLGRYIQKVPQAVVTGFSCGIGAMMFLTQLNTMTGVRAVIDRSSNNALGQTWTVLSRMGNARLAPIVISGTVIVVAFAVARYSSRLPAPLAGVLVAFGVTALFAMHEREVGRIDLTVPPFAGFSWTPADVSTVLPAGLGLAFVASVNILLTSRVVEHFRGRHRHLKAADADGELGAYGVANIVAGMFAAPMSVGIPARSLASVRCGGTTALSNLFHAGFILALVLLGSNFIAHIPIAALAGVTAYIGICLLEWSTWRRLFIMRRVDAAAFLVTALAVLVVNAVLAVAIGCSMYLLRFSVTRALGLRRSGSEGSSSEADSRAMTAGKAGGTA